MNRFLGFQSKEVVYICTMSLISSQGLCVLSVTVGRGEGGGGDRGTVSSPFAERS